MTWSMTHEVGLFSGTPQRIFGDQPGLHITFKLLDILKTFIFVLKNRVKKLLCGSKDET
jgi:hypothetical protein